MKNPAPFLRINVRDVLKGFTTAALAVVVLGLSTGLSSTPPHFPSVAELQALALAGVGAGLAHVLNNFLRNSKDELLKKEAVSEIK